MTEDAWRRQRALRMASNTPAAGAKPAAVTVTDQKKNGSNGGDHYCVCGWEQCMDWHRQIRAASPRWNVQDGSDEEHPWAGSLVEIVSRKYKSTGYRTVK